MENDTDDTACESGSEDDFSDAGSLPSPSAIEDEIEEYCDDNTEEGKRATAGTSKKGKLPERTKWDTPAALSTFGHKTYVTVDGEKPKQRWTESERRNAVSVEGCSNLPAGFGWSDTPRKAGKHKLHLIMCNSLNK